ncbi:MAG: TldD/PmbA family protein [Thermoleophilaceae bacterium]
MSLIDPELARQVIARALHHGGDMAEVYAEDRRDFSLALDDGRIERPRSGTERGASVRVVSGRSSYFGYVDGLDEQSLLAVADSVAQALRGEARLPEALVVPSPRERHVVSQRPEDVAVARQAAILRACDERARSLGAEIAQVSVGYVDERRRVEIFNSEGLAAADDRTRLRLSAQVVARRGDRVETGTQTRGGHIGFELLAHDPELVAEDAARRALTLLAAVDAPSGRFPVVVGNGFGGVLLHEAVGHGLEADAVHKHASVYAGKLGEQLAQAGVTAYDDGAKPNAWGSDGIDDEGTPTQRTTVIEDGRLTSYLYDLQSASQDGAAPTGNGRRQSFRHLPQPRMTNTYFAPGDATPEELIGSIDHGLYAVSFGGGQVEPATGDFVFGVSEGYLIEGGEVTAPVRGATLVGNGLQALAAIDGIAGDLDIATGYCGKGGQSVAAGVGQPHVRIRELTVGGTA